MTGNDGLDQQRLATKVAWLYHIRHLRQRDIAARLGISQSRVSRLLDLAVSTGIVRTTVVPPEGLHAELEEQLELRYGLREAHVFDVAHMNGDHEDDPQLVSSLAQLTAARLQAHPIEAEVIGVTSWSTWVRATVKVMRPLRSSVRYVVETLGDIGPAGLRHEANEVTRQLAGLIGAEPVLLRVPGIAPNRALQESLLVHDRDARLALELLDRMDMALVGIGVCDMSAPLASAENLQTAELFKRAYELGAVGEVCLRFIAADGSPVHSELDELVVGATLDQLRRTNQVMALAGGRRKYRAIHAALVGGWINTLVTDRTTAEYLLAPPSDLTSRRRGAPSAVRRRAPGSDQALASSDRGRR